jgi:hypothetical protein
MDREQKITTAVCWTLAGLGMAALAWAAMSEAKAAPVNVDNAIVFLADVSSSMDANEIGVARESHASAVTSPDVLDAILGTGFRQSMFAYVEFSESAVTVVDWTLIDSAESAQRFAAGIRDHSKSKPRPQQGLTAIGTALSHAYEMFGNCGCRPLFKTVDVAGDGSSNLGVSVSIPREMLLQEGVTINGLPMTIAPAGETVPDYYGEYIIGGPRSFSIELRDIGEMPVLMRRKLLMELF